MSKKYEIPLNESFYKEGAGPRVIIEEGKKGVYIVDRTGETPHDLVEIHGTEIAELIQVLSDYMGAHMMRPFGEMSEEYEEYKE